MDINEAMHSQSLLSSSPPNMAPNSTPAHEPPPSAQEILPSNLEVPGPFTRPPQNSRLLTLPQELHDIIVTFVPRADLLNLYSTCAAFAYTIVPFLLRDITFDWTRPRCLQRQHSLLQRLSQSPDLCPMIRTLTFGKQPIENTTPTEILSLTSKLTTLSYDFHTNTDYPPDGGADPSPLCACCLASTLYSVKDSLTHLNINYHGWFDIAYTDAHVVGHCTLKPLSCLKTAKIPFCVLLGCDPDNAPRIADVLPSRLEELTIREDCWISEIADRQVWDMMGAERPDGVPNDVVPGIFTNFVAGRKWARDTPNLRIFNVVSEESESGSADVSLRGECGLVNRGGKEFQRLCAENGLTCEVFEWWYYSFDRPWPRP